MQDKPHSDFDPRLLDRGWELLQPQLDEVLPVAEKPRRRIAWWWFLLGMFLCIGVGVSATYFYGQTDATSEPIPPVTTQAPLIASETPEMAEENCQENPAVSNDIEKTSYPIATAQVPVQKVSGHKVVATTTAPTEPVALTKPTNELTKVHINNREQQDAVNKLPSLPLSPLNETTAATIALSPPTALSEPSPKFNYFISSRIGGSIAEPHYSYWGIGLASQLRLSRVLALSIGLHYYQSQPGLIQGLALTDAPPLSAGAERFEDISYDNQGRLNVSQSVLEQLHTRQVGLEVRSLVRVSPRWHIALGTELLNYRSAFLEKTITAVNASGILDQGFNIYDNNIGLSDAHSAETMSADEEFIPLTLNRWQWTAGFGVVYQPLPRWSVGLDWRKPLGQWSEVLPDLQTQSTLQLRLRYRLR